MNATDLVRMSSKSNNILMDVDDLPITFESIMDQIIENIIFPFFSVFFPIKKCILLLKTKTNVLNNKIITIFHKTNPTIS